MDTFEQLAPEYERLAAFAMIVPARERELAIVCEHLRNDKELFEEVYSKTSVPTAVLMALAEREMSGNTHCYLGNGQPLNRRTTIVPLNRGPWLEAYPQNFVAGCIDSLHLDGLDKYAQKYGGWSLALLGYASEDWNGWGYRARGIPSPYFVGATTVQKSGKFIRDHVYSATTMDPQLGTLAIVEELVKQDPSLAFYDLAPKIPAPSIVPAIVPHPIMASVNPEWVQRSLNRLKVAGTPLLVDGNVGRGTRAAVRAFQQRHRLYVDGIPGPQVVAALKQALAEEGMA